MAINNKQQTATEWLFNELSRHWNGKSNMTYQQMQDKAKAMEKKQIEIALECGFKDGCLFSNGEQWKFESGEQYYNETYNQ
jgi:hypothetical protein